MKEKKIVLASASPRRRELLANVGIRAEIFPSAVDESIIGVLPPDDTVRELALLKASDVAKSLGRGFLVIGADTVVFHGGEIMGKPKDRADAIRMISALSGDWHTVYSGYAVVDTDSGFAVSKCEETRVKFRSLTDEEIEGYVASGEPMDKAGGYGIQKLGSLLVERIEGDYFTVMGLPVCRLCELLSAEFGVKLL